MSTAKSLFALSIINAASAHITLNANYGAASGGYFHAYMKIPHGAMLNGDHLYTTRVELTVPQGVRTLKPEKPAGWDLTIEESTLPVHEQYLSHGMLKTTAPSKITWQAQTAADGVHNNHLLNIDLQMKIGCSFEDNATNTIWNGQHTLWFQVDQHSSRVGELTVVHTDRWANVQMDSPDGTSPRWSYSSDGSLKPCPYLFIHAGSRCSWDSHTGLTPQTGGMYWYGAYVAEVANTGPVMHIQHALELANEAALSIFESGAHTADFATKAALKSVDDDTKQAQLIAIAALVLGATALGFIAGLCVFRCAAKAAFAEVVAAVPLTSTYPPSKSTTTGLPAVDAGSRA